MKKPFVLAISLLIILVPLQNCLSPFGDIVHIRFEEFAIYLAKEEFSISIFNRVIVDISAVNKL